MTELSRRGFLKTLGIGVVAALTGIKSHAQADTPLEENSKEKFVYIYRDIHDSNVESNQYGLNDFRVIDEFCKMHELQTICIEGWAGNDVDKKRGFVKLNGEPVLIQKLFTTNYNIVGLEEQNLQDEACKFLVLLAVYLFRKEIANIYRLARVNGKYNKELAEMRLAQIVNTQQYQNMVNAIQKVAKRYNLEPAQPPFHRQIDETFTVLPIDRKLYDTYTSPEHWAQFRAIFQEQRRILLDRLKMAREEYAISIISQITDKKTVVVFGSNHYESLVHMLKARNITCMPIN